MKCKNCGQTGNATYCCNSCKLAHKAKQRQKSAIDGCPECGAIIRNRKNIYCSEKCAKIGVIRKLRKDIRLLLEDGKTVREIARIKKVWPKRVKEWVAQLEEASLWKADIVDDYPKVIAEEEKEDLSDLYKPPITLAAVSIQQLPFSPEDQKDAKIFAACVAFLEHKRKT